MTWLPARILSPPVVEMMNAVFIRREALLRDSGLDPDVAPDRWRLVPATLEAIRTLSSSEQTLIFLYGRSSGGEEGPGGGLDELARQVEAGGGRVDGLVRCEHGDGQECLCWGESAAILREPARQFGLHLNECYIIGDDSTDVALGYDTGARPVVPLSGRHIEGVMGRLPQHKDFPVAPDLSVAVSYISVEDDISRQLGHPREATCLNPPESLLSEAAESLPSITVISPLARGVQARLNTSRAQLRDVGRWMSFFVLGAVGLSLGIAYLLTHLYRVQPFPEFVYYLTLQFIPRPVRGALFIAWGLGIILLAARSLRRSMRPPASGRKAG